MRVFSKDGFKLSKDAFLKLKDEAKPYDTNLASQSLNKSLGNENLEPKDIVSSEFDQKHGIYTYSCQMARKSSLSHWPPKR